MSVNIKEIYWLAGILEGEGSFHCDETGGDVRIHIMMNDYDIIEKVKKILSNEGAISIVNNKSGQICSYRICGYKAIEWMMTIYSLMGNRRKKRIKEIIDLWKNREHVGKPSRSFQLGDKCRRGHLIIGMNAIERRYKAECRICRLRSDPRNTRLIERILIYLKEKEQLNANI